MLSRLLSPLGRHARPILAAGIFAGLVFPDLAALLRPLLELAVVLSLILSMLRIDWPLLARWMRRPLPTLATVAWMLVAAPVLAWAAVRVAGLPPNLAVPLVLAAAAPPISSIPGFALLLGLDASLALVIVVSTTALLPLTLAPLSFWLLDLELAIGLDAFLLRILLFIGVPFLATGILRRALKPGWIAAHGPEISGAMVVMLLTFGIAVMDGVTARLLADPATVLVFVAAAFAVNVVMQLLGAAAFLWLGRQAALSIGLTSGYRNMGLMLVLTAGIAGPDMALFVAVAQLPMYMLPTLMHPLYRRVIAAAA